MTLSKEEIEYDTSFKFGDIVENYWASENNPNRTGIVVRVDPKSLYLTDGKGRFWNLVRDKDSKSKIVGHYSDSFLKAERERAGELMEALSKVLGSMALERVERFDIKELCETAINEYNNKP